MTGIWSPSGMMTTFLPAMSGVVDRAGSAGYSVSGSPQAAMASLASAMPAWVSWAVPLPAAPLLDALLGATGEEADDGDGRDERGARSADGLTWKVALLVLLTRTRPLRAAGRMSEGDPDHST